METVRFKLHLYIPPHKVPTMKNMGSLGEKSKVVMHNPDSTARSRDPPALRGLEFSTGLCSLATFNLQRYYLLKSTLYNALVVFNKVITFCMIWQW